MARPSETPATHPPPTSTEDEELERYESLRHRPSRVPPATWLEFHDQASGRAGGGHAGSRRGPWGREAPLDPRVFRDDVHGGIEGIRELDEGLYRGRMRHYVETGPGCFRVEPGPHTGLGPRGYQRPDVRIHDDVCDFLTADGHVDARGIEVRVEDGEVVLEGAVESRRQKRRAEDLAELIDGVRDVHNRLRIVPIAR